jgi:CRISPR-associated protein Csx10
MSMKLTFQIAFESDYHVGAGHGLGTEIDSALLRDADGVLVLRGTLLSGLLRDGLVELLGQASMQYWRNQHPCKAGGASEAYDRFCGQYADEELGPLEMCPVCRIFGSPRTTKRWSMGSARPEGQARVRGKPRRPEQVNSQRVMRARVSPRTRRAEPRKLFSQEHGGQQVFEFVVECPSDDEATLDEATLLVAAARMVRQLGRGRRRGMGECLITLKDAESEQKAWDGEGAQAYLLKRFQKRWLERTEALAKPEPATRPATWSTTRQSDGQEATQEEEVRVRVIARADEPVLIAQRASAGNQFKTQPAITGKTLRGALAAVVAGRFDLNENATRRAFVDLFLRGGVRFSALYPMGYDTHRGELFPAVPVPRDGFTCKVYPGHGIQWGTRDTPGVGDPDQVCLERGCGRPVKAVRGKFVSLSDDKQKPFEPDQRNEMHIQIDRRTGRVTEGQVFEYVALEAGLYFCGELVCANANAWRTFQEFLGLNPDKSDQKVVEVRLGKGRQRGYGKVTMCLEKANGKPPLWVHKSIEERSDEEDQELTLTLLTDTVVTDVWGRFATGFETKWLADALEVKAEDLTIVEECAYAATQLVDSFNTVQQLPRWRDVALAAGSSARLTIANQPEGSLLKKLKAIERDGIGLRRNEGYGRVVVNHPIYTGALEGAIVRISDLPSSLGPGISRREFTRAEFRRKWEENLRRAKWEACAKPSLRGAFAALARWLVAQQAQPPGDLVKVLDVLLAKKEEQGAAQAAVPEALTSTLPALGQPDNYLKNEVIKDYGARDKANKLVQPEAETGVKLIRSKLVGLARRSEWEPFWFEGVAMIAAQIAEATKGQGEGE